MPKKSHIVLGEKPSQPDDLADSPRSALCCGMFRGINQYFRFKIEAKAASRSIPFFPEERTSFEIDAPSGVSPPRHQLWSSILSRHVRKSSIRGIPTNTLDYTGLASDEEFPQYLAQLALGDALEGLSHNEQLATWVNAYNALCAGLIVQFYQREGSLPSSITKLTSSAKGACWDQPAGMVGGKMYTLAEIEHQVVRQQWRSPRVHACLVCASTSCPDLREEAYEGDQLQQQMEQQMSTWLDNSLKGASMMDPDELVLSRIFLWYYKDFGDDRFDVIDYLGPLCEGNAELRGLKETPSRLSYFPYDWGLNHGEADGASGEGVQDKDDAENNSRCHTPRL
eukprot:TRINITY_DN6517_c0_g1_i1.p1 TRINITY_DN6517_c0_g1~~TRINITY_DN6517_c0_g1_i1.p1  ORF type:complete len:339 (+),score=77.34 TRINITY_DN6517_c0_g1_i1:108-1124(+)